MNGKRYCAYPTPYVREGLKAIINSQQEMATVGEAGNGRQVVDAFAQYQPDVTLMDLRFQA